MYLCVSQSCMAINIIVLLDTQTPPQTPAAITQSHCPPSLRNGPQMPFLTPLLLPLSNVTTLVASNLAEVTVIIVNEFGSRLRPQKR